MSATSEQSLNRVLSLDPLTALSGYNLSNIEALVVERNLLMRKTIGGILTALGVKTVRLAENETEAIWAQRKNPADLIFTDWAPRLNGVEVVREMRLGDGVRDPFVPIIMMTANTEERHVFEARDAGMTEFVAKPFSASLIYRRIATVIHRPRPFVRCTDFFGPDRRRRVLTFLGHDRRHNQRKDAVLERKRHALQAIRTANAKGQTKITERRFVRRDSSRPCGPDPY